MARNRAGGEQLVEHGHSTRPGDANHDGIVNGQDIALIASNWLHTSGGQLPSLVRPCPNLQHRARHPRHSRVDDVAKTRMTCTRS